MGKKNGKLTLDYDYDRIIYMITLISVFIASLIIRVKPVVGYLEYNRTSLVQGQTNINTYYKLIFLTILTLGVCIFFIYNRLTKKLPYRRDYVLVGTGLIITSCIIATMLSEFKNVAIMGFFTRNNGLLAYGSLFMLIYIVSNLKFQSKQIRFTLITANILSLIFTIVGIFEYFGHSLITTKFFHALVVPSIYKGATITSSVPLYNAASLLFQPNYFGAYCSIFLPLITVFALNSSRRWEKIFYIFGSFMLFAGVQIAASMGPWITAMAILILLPLLILNKKNLISFIFLYIGFILITVLFSRFNSTLFVETIGIVSAIVSSTKALLGLTVLLVAIVIGLLLRQRVKKFQFKIAVATLLIIVLLSASGFLYVLETVAPNNMSLFSNRGYVWHYSYQELKKDFVFGFGPDNFPYKFPQVNPDAERYSPQITFDKPHNMYLQVLADGGILALVGFVYLLVTFLIKLIRQMFKSNDDINKNYIIAIFLTVAAYSIQGFINDNHISIQPMLYIVIGVGMSICFYLEKNDNGKTGLVEYN